MPSGPKKRKAAKKKMVKEESNNSTSATHSHGEDDFKDHDEKESDGGEINSPGSQDHANHQNSFTTGEEVEGDKKSMEGEGTLSSAKEGDTQINLEFKSQEDFESKNIDIESANGKHDGSSSGSSSSSSSSSDDDESHVVEKNTVVIETAAAAAALVEPVDSSAEKITRVVDGVENSPVVYQLQPIDSLSEVVARANHNIRVEEANSLIVETPIVADSDKVSVLEQIGHANDSAAVDNYAASGGDGSGLKENGEKKLPSFDLNNGVSPVPVELESQKKEDGTVSASDDNQVASSESKGSEENVKQSQIPECSDGQPLVAPAPRTVKTTSVMGCCGLFELFTGRQ